ncbi:MAG: hypothetical protein C9356_18855 [Oleiphilus sp.]|nr:MAG: hypothetical protein C9356_18855 [Oleiphilus sp.]
MGLILLLISYFMAALVMFFAGPFLFWFAAKKFGKFHNNTLKNHAFFWASWFLSNAALGFIQSAVSEVSLKMASFLSTSILVALALLVGLSTLIFQAPFIAALKAAIAYVVFFALTFIVVAFIAIQFSLHTFMTGA